MRIGELARITQTPVETIRYYERADLLPKTARTEGNYRIYTATHVECLNFIRNCRALGMTQDEIRTLLACRENQATDRERVKQLLDAHVGHVAERIRELRQLEKQLKALRTQCMTTLGASDCGILNALALPATAVDTAATVAPEPHRKAMRCTPASRK